MVLKWFHRGDLRLLQSFGNFIQKILIRSAAEVGEPGFVLKERVAGTAHTCRVWHAAAVRHCRDPPVPPAPG